MSLVEKELTNRNIELTQSNPELLRRREREQKFIVTTPTYLEENYRAEALPIEQLYLSTPNDEFSLRLRSTYTPEGAEYTATLKDPGEVVNGARDRLEITTPVSKEAYEWFAQKPQFPKIKKLRAEPIEGVTIDFMEDSSLQIVEVEHNDPSERARLVAKLQEITKGSLVDMTGNTSLDNESLAYAHKGSEHISSPESLDHFTDRVIAEMIAEYATGRNQVVVGLTGMSGSGKTTVTKAIHEKVTELFGDAYAPIVVSTDDYHRGRAWLEDTYGAPWTEWDDPRVYDTAELAFDIRQLADGKPFVKRHFDFDSEEVVYDDILPPSPFVVVEGLYAGSRDLDSVRSLHFELPTGIATSIGRDVRRLVIENRANRVFPTPESRLQYQIESALPIYLSQERPRRNSFSASVRPMAGRAFMLEQLKG